LNFLNPLNPRCTVKADPSGVSRGYCRISRNAVRKYLPAPEVAKSKARAKRGSKLDPYRGYIQKRPAEGEERALSQDPHPAPAPVISPGAGQKGEKPKSYVDISYRAGGSIPKRRQWVRTNSALTDCITAEENDADGAKNCGACQSPVSGHVILGIPIRYHGSPAKLRQAQQLQRQQNQIAEILYRNIASTTADNQREGLSKEERNRSAMALDSLSCLSGRQGTE